MPEISPPQAPQSKWRALLRAPKGSEWLTLFMIAMVLFMAWAYKHDTAECKRVIEDPVYACQICNAVLFPEKYINRSEKEVPNFTLNLTPKT